MRGKMSWPEWSSAENCMWCDALHRGRWPVIFNIVLILLDFF